jgi:hypothetical protein
MKKIIYRRKIPILKSAPSGANQEIQMSLLEASATKARRKPKAMNAELENRVLERIVAGETIRAICGDDETLPSRSAVYMHLAANADFAVRYGRAKFAATEALADEIMEIADESNADWKQTRAGAKPDREVTERSKLRVETRKWLMARLSPTKYGDRTIISDGKEAQTPEEFEAQIKADAPMLMPDEQIPQIPVF